MEQTNSISPEDVSPGPGRMLHRARQDLHLAPEDVAQILHLSTKHIIALEQDDYKNLPGPTYVRGYLRSYAQLLGLSSEKLIESYNALIIPSKPLSLPKSAPPPQVTSDDRLVKVGTMAVVVMVLGLVFLWWRSEGETPVPVNVPSTTAHRMPAAEQTDQTSLSASAPDPFSNSAAGLAANAPSSPTAARSMSQTNSDAAQNQSTTVSAPVPKETGGQVTVSGMILNVSPTGSSNKVDAAPIHTDRAVVRTRRAVDIPPGATRSRLVLRAVQESWADVRDASDNKLLYENIPVGRSIAIEGIAPFNVFLGNADGVEVEFNGKNYDVSRHKRGQVARFTLGEGAAVNN